MNAELVNSANLLCRRSKLHNQHTYFAKKREKNVMWPLRRLHVGYQIGFANEWCNNSKTHDQIAPIY